MQQLETQAQQLRQQAADAMAAAQAARDALEQIKAQQQAAAVVQVQTDNTPAAGGRAASLNAFNPAISAVLRGTYAHHSLPPARFTRSGFPLVSEGIPVDQGLSLGESEIAMAANVDDKFYGQLTLAVGSDDSIGTEEAYIDTLGLPGGLTLRAGRFFSNLGYFNSHHTHTDHFIDRPLVSQAFLGNQFFDDGVQLRWVAPTDLFLELGGELLRGDRFPSGGAGNGGVGVKTAFAHVGGDIGFEQSWLAGLSMLHADVNHAEDGFSGNSNLYIADATWKWAPQGNFKDGGVTLRSEVFLEDRKGWLIDPLQPDDALAQRWNGQRWGAYVQGVYRINRQWETGYRYDYLRSDSGLPLASGFEPDRHTLMLTWLNSEFSLLRLQLSHENPRPNSHDNAIELMYQVNVGAHGAHKF